MGGMSRRLCGVSRRLCGGGLQDYSPVQSQFLSSFSLDLRLWIWDQDLGLGLGLGLDKKCCMYQTLNFLMSKYFFLATMTVDMSMMTIIPAFSHEQDTERIIKKY